MKTVIIVGLGAVGSHVVTALRNIPHPVKIIDFDRVEAKNTQAQMHIGQSLRQNKATAMAALLRGMWGRKVEAVPHKLVEGNVEVLLKDAALVVDCTDNLAVRVIMQGHCKAQGTPLLHAGLSADGTFGRVIWTDLFVPDPETGDGATCEDGENLPFHLILGAYVAQVAQTFLRNGRKLNLQVTPTGVIRV